MRGKRIETIGKEVLNGYVKVLEGKTLSRKRVCNFLEILT